MPKGEFEDDTSKESPSQKGLSPDGPFCHNCEEQGIRKLTNFDKFIVAQRMLDMDEIIKLGLELCDERIPRKYKNFIHINDWLARPRTIGHLALYELAMVTHSGCFQNPSKYKSHYNEIYPQARTVSHDVTEDTKSNASSSAFHSFVDPHEH